MRALLRGFTLLSLFVALALAFSQGPPVTAPLHDVADVYVNRTVPLSGATNVVSAVTFDWRGFDTFGEATLLLTAATGVRAILRRWLQRRRETGRV